MMFQSKSGDGAWTNDIGREWRSRLGAWEKEKLRLNQRREREGWGWGVQLVLARNGRGGPVWRNAGRGRGSGSGGGGGRRTPGSGLAAALVGGASRGANRWAPAGIGSGHAYMWVPRGNLIILKISKFIQTWINLKQVFLNSKICK
jgi:hypothetical protein